MELSKVIYVLSLLLLSQLANAGGLWLNEYGTPAMGRAGAGAQAGVNDSSTVLHNPATMSRLDDRQWMATGGLAYTQTEFDLERTLPNVNGTNDGGDAGDILPGASAFYVDPDFRERWSWGISAAGLAGTGLDYSDSWAGRYQAQRIELLTLAVSPSLAYRVTDWFSVGGSAQMVYGKLELELAVPNLAQDQPDGSGKIDGDDTILAYNLGAMIELSDVTRVGVLYQSEWGFEFSGDAKFSRQDITPVGVDTDLPLAEFLRIAVTHQINDETGLHATLGWDNWSALDKVSLSTNTNGISIDTNWNDTYHYALGVDYRVSSNWLLSTGIAYDTNPVSQEDRNAQLPVDRQVRYAFGAQHQYVGPFSVGGQIVYADLGKARIQSLGYGGEYKTNKAFFFSINANWLL